ncbi:hypothetical protein CUJ83_00135 [Methanocella sp. CWC-04]|uniref:4Fe-4S ferredoxin-type domain-containing protein n=1 Tax=Methanooceanicella nereidis TaxID=2052831 RepID=A0AAP2RAP1_9EURY|nr:DUF362 domain-containing protein [Methanocella sp. CWC-04]MCD1293406.1 hypothetical protein [Methanocella sp. CWC-04]
MPFEVSVIKCDTYEEEKLTAAVKDSLAPLGGLESVVKKGDRVLIKLNLLSSKEPGKAVTTNPALVKTVVKMVQQLGAVPIVGDSPGGRNTGSSYETLLERTGIRQIADDTGCEVVNFDEEKLDVVSDKSRVFKKLTVAKIVTDVDAVICLPKLKTHQFIYYTGAVKLLYGYVPGMLKTEYHLHTGKDVNVFADLLLDIYESFTPQINIMDAIVGMEGPGPQSGIPRNVGLIISSKSGPALDLVATSVIGFDPMIVPTIKKAYERGIGPSGTGEIKIFGEPLENVMVEDFKKPETLMMAMVPPVFMNLASRLLGTRPVIDASMCVMCGKCARDCPPKAISFKKGAVPAINYNACLRCYCCQELCPEGAVKVTLPLIRKLLKT